MNILLAPDGITGGAASDEQVTDTEVTTEVSNNGKDLPDEIKTKLERLDFLEKEHKDIIASRDKAKDERRKQEESKLYEEKKYKELLETKDKELSEIKKALEGASPDAEAYKALRDEELKEAKKKLGKEWDNSFDTLPLLSIRKLVSLAETKKLDVDKGGGSTKVELTPEQKAKAKEMFPYSANAEEMYLEIIEKRKKK